MTDEPEMLTAEALAGLPHGFSTRAGGAPADMLPGGTQVRLKQVHSTDVIVVGDAWPDDQRPEADALVTCNPGLVLAIVTADCAPVLLADRKAKLIGAAHAGWRGAHGGVIEATVAAMEHIGARREDISAAIGPTIAQASYEVDEPFREQFSANDEAFFAPGRDGHWQFDLPAYVVSQLRASQVGIIEDLAEDTYAQPDRFFSFRRATHVGEPTQGRQISMIALGD